MLVNGKSERGTISVQRSIVIDDADEYLTEIHKLMISSNWLSWQKNYERILLAGPKRVSKS